MTPEEFKKTFKVGDKIRRAIWSVANANTITAIGEKKFLSQDNTGAETDYFFQDNWMKVEPEPVSRKPSEEIYSSVDPMISACALCCRVIGWLDENWPKVQKKTIDK